VNDNHAPEFLEYLLEFDTERIESSDEYPGNIDYVNRMHDVLELSLTRLHHDSPIARLLFAHAGARFDSRCKKWSMRQFYERAIACAF
jgi:hypothetical protein